MYNQNSTHNSKLASSIQGDYQRAARNHRLIKESVYEGSQLSRTTTIALTLTTITGFVIALTQISHI